MNLQVPQWPHASQPVQVTMVEPTGKKLPLGGLQVVVMGGQPPKNCGPQETKAPNGEVALTVMCLIHNVRKGGQVCTLTVTEKVQLVVWPQASVAVQVTRVLALAGKQEPLGGLQETVVGPQPPEAVLE